MIVLVVPAAAFSVIAVSVVGLLWRRRSRPPELSGDWWSRFEREFRAYARCTSDTSAQFRSRARDTDHRDDDRPNLHFKDP
jgi:hypothetical protein